MKIASIFKKVLMAVTGLLLVGFLISHLAGNQFIYFGDQAFNAYAEFLESKPAVVYTAEIALLAIFIVHIISAIKLTLENNTARPLAYAEHKNAGESTFASRTMVITGLIVLFFVIVHVRQFKFGDKTGDGQLFGLAMQTFQSPIVLGFYVLSMLALGFHIAHGIGSAFQSLGLFSKNRRRVRLIGNVIGWILALGFAALPIYAFVAKPTVAQTQLRRK